MADKLDVQFTRDNQPLCPTEQSPTQRQRDSDATQATATIESETRGPWHNSPVSLPVPNPTKSFWIDTPHANPLAHSGSSGALTEDADIRIIGSGMTGISTAWHLSQLLEQGSNCDRGEQSSQWSVVVLEAREFCSGATGRNGGHLTPNPFRFFLERELRDGTSEAVKSYAIERYTTDSIVRFIQNKGLASAVDLVNGNHIVIFKTKEDEEMAKKDWDAAKKAGVELDGNVRWISSRELEEKYGLDPSLNYSAVYSSSYNLWPSKFVTELFNDAVSSSTVVDIKVYTHTPVTGVHRKQTYSDSQDVSNKTRRRRWELKTPRGNIDCAYVVHATNGYAGHLLPFLAGRGHDAERDTDESSQRLTSQTGHTPPPNQMPSPEIAYGIVPARDQVGAARASVKGSELGWLTSWSDSGWNYWFPRYKGLPDPTSTPQTSDRPLIILGGGSKHASAMGVADDSTLKENVSEALRNFLPSLFPGKFTSDPESWEMEWSGIMGFTLTGDPFVGPVGPLAKHLLDSPEADHYDGQYISAGYDGHGMPRAFACAQVVAEQIVAELSHKEWIPPTWLPERYLTWAKSK